MKNNNKINSTINNPTINNPTDAIKNGIKISNYTRTQLIILQPIPCHLYVYSFEVKIAHFDLIKKVYGISTKNISTNKMIEMYNDFEPHDDVIFMTEGNYKTLFEPLFKDISQVNFVIRKIKKEVFDLDC